MNMVEYHPGDINAKLLESGVDAKEYSLYGPLSHESHSNLLASLSHVQEMDVGEQGMLRLFHFGSARTAETEYFVQQSFLILFFLVYIALKEPLAVLYRQYSESDIFRIWYGKVDALRLKLDNLTSEMIKKPIDETSQVNHNIQKIVEKRMRFQEFKRRVTGE